MTQIVIDLDAEISEIGPTGVQATVTVAPCKVCKSPFRSLVEAARRSGKSPNAIERHILKKYGTLLGRFSIRTHEERGHHLEDQTNG